MAVKQIQQTMFKALFYVHLISVNLFLLIYLFKTILLLANKNEGLAKFTKLIKVPEMIASTLFLISGIYMLTQIPEIKILLLVKIVVVIISIPVAIIGFKKRNKMLALLSFIMIVAAYGMAEMSKKQKTSATQQGIEVTQNGAEIYSANCISCHGTDGKLMQMGANDLSISGLDMNAKIELIKNGKGAVTAFGSVLNEQQIKAGAGNTAT